MRHANLLVVDDEGLNREIIAESLEDQPWALTMAQDGAAALALLEGGASFDAVVLDRMMPGVDGMEVLRRMQRDPRLRAVPVIMQTAAASREQVAEGLQLGAYYYLTKPYDREALVAVIRAALAMSSQRQELALRIEEYRGVMALIDEGVFRLRTLDEARALAGALGSACSEPDAASLGLVELLVNAIEHGNLGIGFEEKAALLGAGRWEAEVAARHARPENVGKAVRVVCQRVGPDLVITISDEGGGFDWQHFLTLDESRAFHPNGRGISLARGVAFATIEYLGCGNQVRVSLPARRAEGGAAGRPGQRRAE